MHNNIMAAGSKDRPPMLGPGRYSQWRSRFLRYIDMKIQKGEGGMRIKAYYLRIKNTFCLKKKQFSCFLNGMDDDIYSTVDACKTANEMWIAIERLQQGESLNVHDVKTNLFWELRKFTSLDGESMESHYSWKCRRSGSAKMGYSALSARDLGNSQKEAGSIGVKDYLYHKEKMMMCKQAEHGVPLQAKQADWLADTDEEIDEQELEAHYSFMAKIQEVLPEESSSTDCDYELESEKADFSNIYDLLLEECVSKDVTCSYLHSLSDSNAYAELQCLYLHKVKECECLAQKFSKQTESVNKEVHNKLLKSFAKLENHSISLELALQKCKEQMKNNSVCKENGSNVFRKEREQYHEIHDLKAQMQDKNIAISELKKLIEKCKGKSMETRFDKPSVVRQPNAQRIPKPPVLGKPTLFQILQK
ncbi:hypothetical protein Tco_1244192 [Tanacetum coccineum]